MVYLIRQKFPRTCANPKCPMPDRMFMTNRVDRMYCSGSCQAQAWKLKKAGLLPDKQSQSVAIKPLPTQAKKPFSDLPQSLLPKPQPQEESPYADDAIPTQPPEQEDDNTFPFGNEGGN
jgi:hypothetical protein